MKLTVDIGNTRTKFGIFDQNNHLVYHVACLEGNEEGTIDALFGEFEIDEAITCTVANREILIKELISKKGIGARNIYEFNDLGILIDYDTPKTLGQDRIVAACGAEFLFPNCNKLILDAGTCLTYEFVNNKKSYLGGAISPGVRIRFEALNNYTDRLPLLGIQDSYPLIGKSTEKSIISGVQNGIVQEVEGIIRSYEADYENLTVICTGGDTDFFVKGIKSNIFASPNLLLIGLNAIIERNK
jgi:type III pantothenate kinase